MNYHQLDNTWTIWFNTYEEFEANWVIKGKFHLHVPEDIVKSFVVAEYIMAHSWYHYPLYDEALAKIAGIIEMAVKLRTDQLGLPLRITDTKGKMRPLVLKKLVDALIAKEPWRDLDFDLHHMRRVRNIVAHPNKYGFSGGTFWHLVRHNVNTLNMLFMPEELCFGLVSEKQRTSEIMSPFFSGCRVLNLHSKRFLVEKLEIALSVKVDSKWHYLLIAHPVYSDLANAIAEGKFLHLFCLEITDLTIEGAWVHARLAGEEGNLTIEPVNNSADIDTYREFTETRDNVNEHNRHLFEVATNHEPPLAEQAMKYKYLQEYVNSLLSS